ncbi:DUF305 domain-containing protein [Roseibacterium sp. SDUM158017]|uniref:DUF305 domain-containing protein n=1 Tax=Roseicyclus salinarum TaxID=3036773 RepID=UPI0024151F1A|nr:DUF305 domain-containing protein [Roseibacterium sp. SDUM158017]MDG4650420.1 DUF305 domain-containing protein [Roseibacterium sp. SDUM158017]
MSYWRFGAMILTSTVVMFGLMYLNTYALEHLFWSETRLYMAILMGAAMAFVMLGYMLSMYSSRAVNAAIFAGAVVVFAAALWLVRSQETVQDRSFMSAMIPHHSIAIMTASRSELSDARVEKLAREIVLAQNREISEMRYLLADIGRNGETGQIYEDPPARVGTLQEALDNLLYARLDPAPIGLDDLPTDAETGAVDCGFRRVRAEDPVLWTNEDGALMNLNGVLVPLERQEAQGARVWGAEGVTMTVREAADADWRGDAELIFALEDRLAVGYRGFFDCDV